MHCVLNVLIFFFRGNDFRPEYLKCVTLRGIFPNASFLGLSATIHSTLLSDVIEKLQFYEDQVEVVHRLPDRPNIFLKVVHKKSNDFEEDLNWIIAEMREHQSSFPKTIIFVQTILQATDIYEYIKVSLGNQAYCEGIRDQAHRLVSLFHGQVGQESHRFTLDTFPKTDSNLRLLISTIAFGMGVEVKDVSRVIHWGKVTSVLCFWQEIGRAGRDGRQAKAIWYPKSNVGEDKPLFEQLKRDQHVCIRKAVLQTFVLGPSDNDYLEKLDSPPCQKLCEQCECQRCLCCSHGLSRCPCRL